MTKQTKIPLVLITMIAAQSFCAVVFLNDLLTDFNQPELTAPDRQHLYVEAMATFGLLAAIGFEVKYLLWLLRRKAHLENSLRIANTAIHDVIEAEFEAWNLTPAEQDVATFLVKGLSISEIAGMRGSAEGTVKAHLNAIYRKSGTKSRGEMLSLLIDTLMGQPGRPGAAEPTPG